MDYRKGVRAMNEILIRFLALGLMTLVSCKTGEEQLSLEKQRLGGESEIMSNEGKIIQERAQERRSCDHRGRVLLVYGSCLRTVRWCKGSGFRICRRCDQKSDLQANLHRNDGPR